VHILHVPPLRERRSDVPELAGHFLSGICARLGVRRKRIDTEALECLMAYDWRRNNVRELRNIIERMIIAADTDVIGIDQVPGEVRDRVVRGGGPAGGALEAGGAMEVGGPPAGGAEITGSIPGGGRRAGTFHELKAEAERRIIVAALERNDWHITRTAKELGLADHASLLKIMRRHDLKRT
jgi:DNA-binding NtrC family response regulator